MPKPKEEKTPLLVRISTHILNEFRELAYRKHRNPYGALSFEVEEALKLWLVKHTQKHTKTLAPNIVNPTPKVRKVYAQVKKYLTEKYHFTPNQVPLSDLYEAIGVIRGPDKRTLQKWVKLMVKDGCIKWIAGEIYELT